LIKFSFSYKITTTIFKPIVPPSLIIINFYHTPSQCQSSHSRHIEGILKSRGFCNFHFLPNRCGNPSEKMQFNPNFDPAQNPERIPFKFCPDYGALPFSSTHSPAMREPKLNMSTVPVQNNYNYFQTDTPSIANHRISGTSKASVPRSSDTSSMPMSSIMSSMPTNGMECTSTTVKIPVKLLSR